jgi:hypothetical protein
MAQYLLVRGIESKETIFKRKEVRRNVKEVFQRPMLVGGSLTPDQLGVQGEGSS